MLQQKTRKNQNTLHIYNLMKAWGERQTVELLLLGLEKFFDLFFQLFFTRNMVQSFVGRKLWAMGGVKGRRVGCNWDIISPFCNFSIGLFTSLTPHLNSYIKVLSRIKSNRNESMNNIEENASRDSFILKQLLYALN